MFTRNYWKYKAAEFANKTLEITDTSKKPPYITITGDVIPNQYGGSSTCVNSKLNMTYSDINSALNNPKNIDYFSNLVSSTSQYSQFTYGVFFGSGTTPPTVDDYKFEGSAATGFTHSMIDVSEYSDDGSYGIIGRTYTITNNNDTDIVIGEIGIFNEMRVYTAYTGNSIYTTYPYLIERTVLESPITIPANGGVGQVTYKIRMDYPVPAATE